MPPAPRANSPVPTVPPAANHPARPAPLKQAHLTSGLCMSMGPLRPMPPVSLSQDVKASSACSRARGSGAVRHDARICSAWRTGKSVEEDCAWAAEHCRSVLTQHNPQCSAQQPSISCMPERLSGCQLISQQHPVAAVPAARTPASRPAPAAAARAAPPAGSCSPPAAAATRGCTAVGRMLAQRCGLPFSSHWSPSRPPTAGHARSPSPRKPPANCDSPAPCTPHTCGSTVSSSSMQGSDTVCASPPSRCASQPTTPCCPHCTAGRCAASAAMARHSCVRTAALPWQADGWRGGPGGKLTGGSCRQLLCAVAKRTNMALAQTQHACLPVSSKAGSHRMQFDSCAASPSPPPASPSPAPGSA